MLDQKFLYSTNTKIERIRELLCDARREINQVNNILAKVQLDQITHIAEGTTVLIHLLHKVNQDIINVAKNQEDSKMSPSIPFSSRGIGIDAGDCCFVCGEKHYQYNNISGFVRSKLAGEAVIKLFPQGAWLDYRESEPDWIQVKITSCTHHLDNLKLLDTEISKFNCIRKEYIDLALTK